MTFSFVFKCLALLNLPRWSTGIPFIDLEGFSGPNATTQSRLAVAEEWDRALRDYGFAAVTSHNVSVHAQHGLFEAARVFFSQPTQQKLAAREGVRYGGGGYTPPGVESVARTVDGQALPPDLVENFVFLPGALPLQERSGDTPNDPVAEALGESAWEYWQQMSSLVTQLHELSAMALGLQDINHFSTFYDPNPSFALRLAHYPPIDRDTPGHMDKASASKKRPIQKLQRWLLNQAKRIGRQVRSRVDESGGSANDAEKVLAGAFEAGGVRYGAHTDYQGFTVLRPDPSQPGLEVFVPKPGSPVRKREVETSGAAAAAASACVADGDEDKGKWVPVPEDKIAANNALVINIGDLFQQWTNDRWRSTLHRVRNPEQGTPAASQPRLSLVFFTGPRDDATIEVLPETLAPGETAAYGPVVAGDHLHAKLAASNTI